nr:MAG TPA: hypothetical protein [Caudoviricetes sp.]
MLFNFLTILIGVDIIHLSTNNGNKGINHKISRL